jgi:hypothetical protein
MSKARGNVLFTLLFTFNGVHEGFAVPLRLTVTDDLISGYRASGTKLAGTTLRLLCGTREPIVALLTAKGRKRARMARYDRDGSARISYETQETGWSEGADMFKFQKHSQPEME